MSFSFIKLTGAFIFTGALMAAGSLHAQERAAGGAMETQMTWSALKSLVDAANAKSSAVDARLSGVKDRVDSIEKCSLKKKIYSPEREEADKDGCVTSEISVDYLRRIAYTEEATACIQKGGEFTPRPNAGNGVGWQPGVKTGDCSIKVDKAPDCRLKTTTASNGFPTHSGCQSPQPCPDGYDVFPGSGGGGGGDRTGSGCGVKVCTKIVCK